MAYCKAHSIKIGTYYTWFQRLKPKHPEWTVDLPTRGRKPEATPAIEVVEKARRRAFSAGYKARILREVEMASPGQQAAILRREGLYASHLQKWRTERDVKALAPKQRGPKANPLAAENKKLKADKARLQKSLAQAQAIIELQKKVSEILGVSLEQSDEDE